MQDRNKGISGIAYNHLSLPRLIRFGSGADSIVFRYSAAGQKVAKLVYQTGKPTLRTDYLGPFQYEQDSLRFFPHAEGRVLRVVSKDAAGQATTRYEREFTFKDHLGNLRLAYRAGQRRVYEATLEQDWPWLKVWSRSRIWPMGMDEKWLKRHENGPFWMPIVAPPVVRH